MITRRSFLAVLGISGGAAALAAGGYLILPGDETLSGDPRIRYGKEPCSQCTMIISDERFAAAWREQGRLEHHFDDVGCMISYARKHPPAAGTAYYVHDFGAGAWLDAPSAAYVAAPGIKSPMAYDVAAFASAAGAGAFERSQHGRRETWASLMTNLQVRG